MVERQKILDVFSNIGVLVDEKALSNDIDLTEYISDSIQFISFIVELERYLQIELPDEFLLYENIRSLNGFMAIIEQL